MEKGGTEACKDCNQGCKTCEYDSTATTPGPKCTACNSDYGFSSTDNSCTKCVDGKYSEGGTEACKDCNQGCKTCEYDSTATPPGPKCTACAEGYGLKGGVCTACGVPNCIQCSVPNGSEDLKCDKCQGNADPTYPSDPEAVIDPQTICPELCKTNIPDNCAVCVIIATVNTCTKCESTYGLEGTTCKPCSGVSENCIECSVPAGEQALKCDKEKATFTVEINQPTEVVAGTELTASIKSGQSTVTEAGFSYEWKYSETNSKDDQGTAITGAADKNTLAIPDNINGKYVFVSVTYTSEDNKYVSGPIKSNVIGPVASSTPTGCNLVGCKTCVENNNEQCKECYTDLGFVLKENQCQCNTESEYGFAQEPVNDDAATGGKRCTCADTTQTNVNGKCVSNQPQPPQEKDCIVSNCLRCSKDDNTYCEECNKDYGLRGGYCTKCGDDLYDSNTKRCKYDCSAIENCREFDDYYDGKGSCTVENGEFYCLRCESGFHQDEKKKSCIPYQYPPFSCSLYYPGCTRCNEDQKCEECDTSAHWKFDNETKRCDCEEGYDTDNDNGNQCLEIFKECNDNCQVCLGPNKVCTECKTGFGLKDGKCTECGDGLFYSVDSPCLITNCPVKNCANCTDYNNADYNYCYKCKEGFTDQIEGHYDECINKTTVDCNVFGCTKCYAGTNICSECNKTLNMEMSRVHYGTCVCMYDYDFVNEKCVRPKAPYVQPEVNTSTLQSIQLGGTGGDYKLEEDPKIKDGNKGYFKFNPDAKSIKIDKFQDYPYYFELENGRKTPFTVDIPEATVTDIKCSGSELNLPSKNSININGGGELTLNTIGGEEDLKINTVTIQSDSNDLTFKSTNANITVGDLDIFGTKICNGQEPIGEKIYQTVCTLLRVEANSKFTPKHLKLNKIKAGLRSEIIINTDNDVDISGAPINLYHLANQFGNQNAPLLFEGSKKPSKVGEIHILKLNEGDQVPKTDEEENFTVAQFDLTGQDNHNECTEMAKNFKGGEGFASDKVSCDEYEKGKYRLVATKSNNNDGGKKKKKLSAGAIAGIVIACVVVVAAIIALLVYFLVIKKKNQSTTSTQGDSSIAI